MKKLMTAVTVIFALSFMPAASHAGWMGGPSVHNPTGAGYRVAQSGNRSFEPRASTIIGTYVENQKGQYLGKVTDLMIDPENNGITFAILSRGGELGIPMKFVAIPFRALTISGEKNIYFLNIRKERMDAAPSFNRNHWPDVTNRAWETDTYRYYGLTPQWSEPSEPGMGCRFSQMRGAAVKNPQGKKLGRIWDIVIDSQGHVPFAVVSHGGFWGIDSTLVAIPFSALHFEQPGKNVILDTTTEKLDSAPPFKMGDLGNKKWTQEVYRFFGQHPYWTE